MKNRMRELRTCGTVRGEGHEVLAYSEKGAHCAQKGQKNGSDSGATDMYIQTWLERSKEGTWPSLFEPSVKQASKSPHSV
jgi:hypothetical protein